MSQATYHFPRGFLWGTATAAHQVEGNNSNNNWWAWEQQEGRIQKGHKSGLACDWWGGRWREDFDRAAEAGQNAHRFSVEWSRIQPAPDRWDEDALDHYREMARGLQERNMLPMVTLHHFTDPLWLMEHGGWENDETPALFEAFTRKVVEALKEYVSLWCTINEPNVYSTYAYIMGDFPPGKTDIIAGYHVLENLIRGHAAAYHAIHAIQPIARVGFAHHHRLFTPAQPWFPLDSLAARLQSIMFNEIFPRALVDGIMHNPIYRRRVPEAKGTQDYFGLNYYTKDLVSFDLRYPKEVFGHRYFAKDADLSGTGFLANDPEGFFTTLNWAKRFNLPILVTENGVEDPDDQMRPRYLAMHIRQLWRGVNFNWPIKGYFHWSLIDNFEWERGWTQRFGLWEVDPETQARRKRTSADLYAEICRENGLSSEMVAKYCPEAQERIFPDEKATA